MPRSPNDFRQAGDYTGGMRNVNEYTLVPGVCVLPVAEDAPQSLTELEDWSPVAVLRLHAPYRIRKFTQAGGKQTNPPPIAAPGDTGAFVFLGGTITVTNGQGTGNQDLNWGLGAEYLYVEDCTVQDANGEPLGLVLGKLPFDSVLDRFNAAQFGFQPPGLGAASLGGRAATAGFNAAAGITAPGNTGELADRWNYNAQAFYPAQLFYTDLPNGGKPVARGG